MRIGANIDAHLIAVRQVSSGHHEFTNKQTIPPSNFTKTPGGKLKTEHNAEPIINRDAKSNKIRVEKYHKNHRNIYKRKRPQKEPNTRNKCSSTSVTSSAAASVETAAIYSNLTSLNTAIAAGASTTITFSLFGKTVLVVTFQRPLVQKKEYFSCWEKNKKQNRKICSNWPAFFACILLATVSSSANGTGSASNNSISSLTSANASSMISIPASASISSPVAVRVPSLVSRRARHKH